MQAVVQTFSKGGAYKRPAVWEQPDVLRQFQEHVLETTKNTFSLEDTKQHAQHNNSYVQFMRKARTAKEQADATKDESQDTVNLGMHPYRCLYSWHLVAEYHSHYNKYTKHHVQRSSCAAGEHAHNGLCHAYQPFACRLQLALSCLLLMTLLCNLCQSVAFVLHLYCSCHD